MTEPQLEILLAAQMGPEASCAFNESMTIEFDGPVNASALAGALDDFVARHDAMRATVKEGEAVLTISPEPHIPMAVISNVDDAELERIRGDEARKPFDLVNGPLLRAVLAEKKNGCAALIFTAHHIVFDGWTVNILAHELAAFYRARTGGETVQLDPALSYADYALSKAAGNPEAEAHLDYWRQVFADVPAPIELPGDRPRPGIKSFAGATFIDMIDADLTAATRKAGAKLGCTLFATLFGALQATLGRIAECEDVVLGCPTAGQSVIEDGVLAGHCVNFLPMRAPFTMATPIGEHLRAVKAMALEALEHGSATYGAIVRSLGLPHDLNRTPLTDVQFNLEQLGEAIDFGGTSADLRANPKASVNFALFFNMVETGQGLRVEVDYASDLFDESTIARWVENLRQTLRGIAADASTPIGELDILGAGERAWLDARNPVWPRLADDCSVPSEFVRAAAAYPDHVALACNGRTMTYAELEARSNRFAHALRARGIGKGDFVALLSGRSIEAIEMILGVIKTGAAYVPLDPAYPPARQAYVLEDCGARLLLLGPAAQEAEAFAELRERGLEYEALSAEAAGLSGEPLDHVVHGDDPIYVMYTSGSTGKPKGVVVPHRGVVRLVVDQDYVELGPDETLMLLTALGFDLCQFEIWGALLFGGKLAIVPQTKPSLDDISQVIVEEGVTTALLAAALFHLICEERMAALAPLRQLVIGADVVSRTLVRRAQEALPHLRFVNGYGPTENSGLTTCYVFPPEGWGPGSSPIGQPIARSTAYIMDRRGRLSPQGAIGELWSGGEGVAIGYLGKPELTDEKFVPHPNDPAQRLYRTGDYARWRNDGAIEFFGRIDGQLKINGMRVELDEIEAVLCEVAGVGEAAVTVRSVPSGGKTVHAFVTTARGREFASAALDHHVAERLPRHMQPATVELIDKLPLNANGKVDRAALLKLIGSTQGAPRGAPQLVELNALEATVGAIWEEVLGVEKVRHDDALFDLGADSLQIFRISARMADKGYRLDNRKLLANPTLSEVCEMLTAVLQKNEPAKEAAKIAPLSAYRRTAMRETA